MPIVACPRHHQAALYQRRLYSGLAAEVDLEAVESLIETLLPNMATRVRYFAGRFLEIDGVAEEGEAYLRQAATANTPKAFGHIIARTTLRDRGTELSDMKPIPPE